MLRNVSQCSGFYRRPRKPDRASVHALRSVHTRRKVAPTRRDDTSQRQIASCVLENFCENLCLCYRILSQRHVAKNQIRQNLCDLSRRQNSVAETRSDFSLRCVAATCCYNQSPDLYTRSDLSPLLVAATCRLVCIDLKNGDRCSYYTRQLFVSGRTAICYSILTQPKFRFPWLICKLNSSEKGQTKRTFICSTSICQSVYIATS